jgi:hypothetical protein
MSFPGSYNIRYYYGDTLEFRIFPKNASGEIFDLNTFTDVRFTLAQNRNTPASQHITCFSQISSDKTNILCTIRPEDSELLNPDIQYVYDVEISKPSNPYDIVYTLLTGNVTILRDVTRTGDEPPPPEIIIPDNPTNLNLINATATTLEVSWTAPEEGPPPDFYKVAILSFTNNQEQLFAAIGETDIENLLPTQTSFTFENLNPDSDYSVVVVATNNEGFFNPETILTNDEAFSTLEVVVPPETVNNPEDLTFTSATASTMSVGWQPPSFGIEPSGYKLVILPFTENQELLENAVSQSSINVSGSTFSRTFSGLSPSTEYSIVIVSLDSLGNFNLDSFLTNEEPFITAAEEVGPPPEPDFFITNDGSGAYLIDGVPNDTITLVRGQSYVFEIDATGHPFYIQTVPAPYSASDVYSDGIEGNGTAVGIITWTVDESAPSTLYYVCQFHPAMTGTILIIDGDNGGYDEYDES